MNLLLDTQAWLWFHLGDARFSQRAREHVTDPINTNFVSPASYWELAIKIKLGKYVLNIPYSRFMHDSISGNRFNILDIKPAHTELISTLPFPKIAGVEHRDPFDRLLISQAKVEGMSVVSSDSALAAYGVPLIW